MSECAKKVNKLFGEEKINAFIDFVEKLNLEGESLEEFASMCGFLAAESVSLSS